MARAPFHNSIRHWVGEYERYGLQAINELGFSKIVEDMGRDGSVDVFQSVLSAGGVFLGLAPQGWVLLAATTAAGIASYQTGAGSAGGGRRSDAADFVAETRRVFLQATGELKRNLPRAADRWYRVDDSWKSTTPRKFWKHMKRDVETVAANRFLYQHFDWQIIDARMGTDLSSRVFNLDGSATVRFIKRGLREQIQAAERRQRQLRGPGGSAFKKHFEQEAREELRRRRSTGDRRLSELGIR